MSTLYRAQILLEPEQHHILAEMAQKQSRSLSDLIREIIRDYLAQGGREARLKSELEALNALTQIRKQIQETHGTYPGDPLAEARAEREQEMERVWSERA